jgi:hypothetical protein
VQVLTLYLQLLGLLPLLRTPWPMAVEGLLLVVSSIMYGTSGLGSISLGLDCLLGALLAPQHHAQDPGTGSNSTVSSHVGAGPLPAPALRLLIKVSDIGVMLLLTRGCHKTLHSHVLP